ncbi:MAG: GDP-mannose 4,6-dehydratase [Anaerolineae bacterium]|nr:GDP-mannose 4,6-dehydratase [Anaerolineae bacterium]
MTKILVTGGAGFIGSHTVQALLNRGDEVICLDNFNDYYSPQRKYKNAALSLGRPGYTLIEGDVRDEETLRALFEAHSPQRIVHIAAMAGVRYSIRHPHLYESVNVRGTLNVLEMARQHGVEHIVFASTSSIYGARQQVPFREDDRVDEQVSPYAATKRACELLAYTYYHLYKLNFTALRFFTVYGPRGRPDMAPYLFTEAVFKGSELKMFGDGSSSRDYTYIDDIVQGVVVAIDRPLGYEIINLGNSRTVYLRDFIALVEQLVGKKANVVQVPMPPGDVPRTFADISKAQRLLDYNPQTPFETGLARFVDWYRAEVAVQ